MFSTSRPTNAVPERRHRFGSVAAPAASPRIRRLAASSLRLPAEPEARAPAITSALEAIARRDAAFDAQALLQAVPERYLDIRRARAEGDAELLRRFVAAGLLEEWQREGGEPAAWPDLTVEEVRLVWAEAGGPRDRLTVGVDSLSEADGGVHTLTEYWTLARPAGTDTPAAGAAAECPNCGAPWEEARGVCRYCGAELPGPLFGWQLERVDEEVDWYEGTPGSVV
jgi:predicted lipid-binding transport protein (Tim44 family)